MVKILNPLNPYDRPGEDYDQDNQAAGDSSDPRGPYDPQTTPLGDSGDPRDDEPKKRTRAADALRSPLNNMAGRGLRKPKDKKDDKQEEDGRTKKKLNDAENQPGLYNPEDAGKGEANPSDLKDEEDSGGLFNPGKDTKKDKARDFLKRHKKKAAVGGTLILASTIGIVGITSLLLPLKVEHIMSNLENKFFANAHEALREETSNMFKEYLITRVMPGYQTCGSTIKPGCTATKFGDGPVSNLYRSWADARVENKLWQGGKGIKIEKNRLSQTFRVYGPGLGKDGEDIGKDGKGLDRVFRTHPEMEAFVNGYMKDNTAWYQVHHRFQVDRRLVNGKNGNNRFCLISCKLTKPLNPLFEKVDEKKLAYKIFLTKNVVLPRNEALGVALLCLINTCGPTKTEAGEAGPGNPTGAPQSEYDVETMNAMHDYADSSLGRKLTGATLDEALQKYNEIAEIGVQKWVTTKALTPIIGQAAATGTADVIPLAGWLNLGAQIVTAGDGADSGLKKLNYTVNGLVGMVAVASTYLAERDEIHTGLDSAAEVGSFAQSLSPGNHGEPSDPIVGGTAGAEQSPLYANLIEGKSVAQSTANVNKNYRCNNGGPPPAGKMICPELELGGENAITAGIHDFLNSCPVPTAKATGVPLFCPKSLVEFANLWKSTLGVAFDAAAGVVGTFTGAASDVAGAVCGIPGVGSLSPACQLKEQGEKLVSTIANGVVSALVPNPFGTNMGGGRNFDLAAGGMDVLGNEDSHTVLGGQKLTPRQHAEILNNQRKYEERTFASKPLFARMFDTNNQYSLVSKVAMEVPLGGKQAAAQSGVATLLNPVGAISRGFSSIFSGKASADPEVAPDPFGVPQYGYPSGTIPKNPEAYWEANCSDDAAHAYQKDGNSWNEAAAGEANTDPENGMPLNTTTNPCMLIKASIGAAGGLFDTGNLEEADLGGVSSDGADGAAGSVASDTIDLKTLYDSSVDIACAPNTKDLGIADGYHDNKKVKIRICAVSNVPSTSSESSGQYGVTGADGKLIVNSRVSKVIYDMAEAAKKAGISTDADSGFRTMAHQECLYAHTCGDNPAASPGTSNHQMGVAVDWGEPMYTWMANGNGAKFGFKALVGGEPWHWSPTGN